MKPVARMTTALFTLALSAAAVLAAPAAAFYTSGSWVEIDPIPFDPLHLGSTTVLASNHTGGVLAVAYEAYDGTAHLFAFTYSLAGGWGGRTELNDTGENLWMDPACALGDDGSAVAAWVYQTGPNATIWARSYKPGVGWDGPTKLGGTPDAFGVQAAIGSDGRAMVVWTDNVTGEYRNSYAVRPAGQSWSAAANIDPATGGFQARIDAGPTGTILAAWSIRSGNDTAVRASRFTPGAGWSAAVNVSASAPGIGAYAAVIKAAPDGGAFVAWQESNLYVNVSARHMQPEGTWDPVQALTTTGFVYSAASLVVDAGGNATVAWIEAESFGYQAQAARFHQSGGWGANVSLGESDLTYTAPVLASDADSVVTALWAYADGNDHVAAFAQFFPGVGWSEPRPITRGGASPDGTAVAFDDGYVLFVATYGQGEALLFDRVAPALLVTGPGASSAFSYPVIDVTGTTEPGASVSVNGLAATVDAGGAWTVRVELGTGPNILRTRAVDPAGNAAFDNRTVTFTDPVPALEAALAEAQANASAAQAAAAAAEANVTATNAQVTALQNAMAASSAEQVRLQAEINALNQSVANAHPSAPAASDGLALMIAVVGVALGAGGLAVGMMAQRRGRAVPPPEAPPKP